MKILTMPVGAYQTNCYMVWGEGDKCVLIDPGYEANVLLEQVEKQGKQLEVIFLTHGHFDHVGAVKDIAAETDCKVYIHPQELALPEALTAGKLYYTHTYDEGDTVTAAGLTFEVLHTPGHTPGGVCLLCEDTMFSGDTLFAGSCGRTDFPGGDWNTIRVSLRRLAKLPRDYKVLPGHAEASTLSREKKTNP
nr:MBL fold metallo-hydrolase [Oscillospiraceae bacterium]